MEKIKIIADSTCDLPAKLQEKYQITIIPLNVVLGDESYFDGEQITPDEIYAWAEEHKKTPKTAAIGFDRMQEAAEQAQRNGEAAICFCLSTEMSTTANVMRMVKEELEYDRMFIIDSRNLTCGIGLMVIRAAELAAEGLGAEEIVSRIEAMRDRICSSFVVERLDYLAMGGRCSAATALFGGALKIKPRIEVHDGKMSAGKKYRGSQDKVIWKYVQDLEPDLRTADPRRVFLVHSGCSGELLEEIRVYLENLQVFDEILLARAGGVISSHCGPETLGVIFLRSANNA